MFDCTKNKVESTQKSGFMVFFAYLIPERFDGSQAVDVQRHEFHVAASRLQSFGSLFSEPVGGNEADFDVMMSYVATGKHHQSHDRAVGLGLLLVPACHDAFYVGLGAQNLDNLIPDALQAQRGKNSR
jgi:hypothetical protein